MHNVSVRNWTIEGAWRAKYAHLRTWKNKLSDLAQIRRKAERASGTAVPSAFRGTARRSLLAWIDAAKVHGVPFSATIRRLAAGEAAVEAGRAALEGQIVDPNGAAAQAACAEGCAFCCILSGEDGGTVTALEATRLHEALAPFAGTPDGRRWHPSACPALDPESLACRAYEARPSICRSYLSSDRSACKSIAEGTPQPGPGVLAGHVLGLSVLALTREALRGTAAVPTHSLARLAEATVNGADLATALDLSRHAPRELKDEMARHKGAMKA